MFGSPHRFLGDGSDDYSLAELLLEWTINLGVQIAHDYRIRRVRETLDFKLKAAPFPQCDLGKELNNFG